MEMEKEQTRLLSVLRRIASSGYAAWIRQEPDAARFCVGQYNKVLARLSEIEPNIKTLFRPLADDTSGEVVRIAARDLGAYFDDRVAEPFVFKFGFGCRPRHHRSRVRCVTVPIGCD